MGNELLPKREALTEEQQQELKVRRCETRLTVFKRFKSLDHKKFRRFFNALRAGATDAQAAAMGGFLVEEIQQFIEWGRKNNNSIWGEFIEEYLMATAAPEMEFMAAMRESAIDEMVEDRTVTDLGKRYARAAMPDTAALMDAEPKANPGNGAGVGIGGFQVTINNRFDPESGKPVTVDAEFEEAE